MKTGPYHGMSVALFFLQITDTIFTAYLVGNSLAIELNPLMSAAMSVSMWLFVVVKLVLAFVSCYVLSSFAGVRFAVADFFLTLVVTVFSLNFMYQLFHVISFHLRV